MSKNILIECSKNLTKVIGARDETRSVNATRPCTGCVPAICHQRGHIKLNSTTFVKLLYTL